MSQYRKGYIFERKTNSYLQEKLSYHKELKFYAIESRGSKGSADIIFGLYNKKGKYNFEKLKLNAHILKFYINDKKYEFNSKLPTDFLNFFRNNNLKLVSSRELKTFLKIA